MIRRFLLGVTLSAALGAGPARADDIAGIWLRESGLSKVRFAPCGAAICGNIVWIQAGVDTKALVGQRCSSA